MSINDAKTKIAAAKEELHKAIKDEIREGLEELFADETVNHVVFGVTTTPYNDENPGIGIHGPKVNIMEYDEDGDLKEIEYDHEGPGYELFYDYRGANHAGKLRTLFTEIDALDLADAFSMRYGEHGGEAAVFVAERQDDGYFDFHSYTVESN